jgi:aminodeoxyfutalosine deaminase
VPADADQLAELFRFRDFPHFIEIYAAVTSLITTAEDIAIVIDGAAADLARQNVPYAEMTVTPYMHTVRGMAYGAVVEGLAEGRRRARDRGVELAWIYDIPGEHGQPGAAETVRYATQDPPDGLVAFGLAGAEAGVDRAAFAWAFAAARAAGLPGVPHAGEGDGPASIWAALRHLEPVRIGHGVRAVEDPRLVEHLAATGIPLEVCPSSNVCTRVFPSIEDHAIGPLMEAGVVVTINTDDPPMFATTLVDEYRRVAAAFDLDVDAVAGLVANGIRASFLPDVAKRRLLDSVDAVRFRTASAHGGGEEDHAGE